MFRAWNGSRSFARRAAQPQRPSIPRLARKPGWTGTRKTRCADGAEGAITRISPTKALPALAPSRTGPTAQDAFPWLIRRNRPTQRTADTRRRRSDRFVVTLDL